MIFQACKTVRDGQLEGPSQSANAQSMGYSVYTARTINGLLRVFEDSGAYCASDW